MARNIAVSKLIQYLRIKTVHPEPDYGKFKLFNNQKIITLNLSWSNCMAKRLRCRNWSG